VIEKQLFKKLEFYLISKDLKIREQTIISFGNLIATARNLRKNFLNHKILINLLKIMNEINSTKEIIANGIWLIYQLVRQNPKYDEVK
jgi:hypothetical protein